MSVDAASSSAVRITDRSSFGGLIRVIALEDDFSFLERPLGIALQIADSALHGFDELADAALCRCGVNIETELYPDKDIFATAGGLASGTFLISTKQ